MTDAPGLPASFDGAVAVVTGSSRGLGAGMAERLGELGFRLALCARETPGIPAGVDADRVLCRSVDVTDQAAVDAFATETEARFGPVTLWINNAGILGPIEPARDVDPDRFREAFDINVLGVLNGSAAFAHRARGWPHARRVLVNISSGAAKSVYPGWATYGPTKAAVDHLSRHLAAEEPELIVRAIAPGVIDTDMQAEIRASDPQAFPAIERFHELHRRGDWNTPAWVADHIAAVVAGSWGDDDVVLRIPNAD